MSGAQCLILCKSVHHGNTARVARAMADALGEAAVMAAPEDVSPTSLGDYGLLGLGSGVFYGRMHPVLEEWVCGLPEVPERTMPAFVFSTSGLPFLARLWHWPLKRLLARKGVDVVGEFACRGFDTWGPLWFAGGLNRKHPDDRDLARAREFAGRLGRAAYSCSPSMRAAP